MLSDGPKTNHYSGITVCIIYLICDSNDNSILFTFQHSVNTTLSLDALTSAKLLSESNWKFKFKIKLKKLKMCKKNTENGHLLIQMAQR